MSIMLRVWFVLSFPRLSRTLRVACPCASALPDRDGGGRVILLLGGSVLANAAWNVLNLAKSTVCTQNNETET